METTSVNGQGNASSDERKEKRARDLLINRHKSSGKVGKLEIKGRLLPMFPEGEAGSKSLPAGPARLPKTVRAASWHEEHLRETWGSPVASWSSRERRMEPPVRSVVSGFGTTAGTDSLVRVTSFIRITQKASSSSSSSAFRDQRVCIPK